MTPRILVGRRAPVSTIANATADVFARSVVERVAETYKRKQIPTTSAAVVADLTSMFSNVTEETIATEYFFEKDPVTCLTHLVCRDGSTITVNDGTSNPVIVTIHEERIIV